MIDVIVITGVLWRLIMIIAKPFFFFLLPSSGKWKINFTSSERSMGEFVVHALRLCFEHLPL